jgi:hypothetical protein
VLKTLLSVLNIDNLHKDGTMKSESEIQSLTYIKLYVKKYSGKSFHPSKLSGYYIFHMFLLLK